MVVIRIYLCGYRNFKGIVSYHRGIMAVARIPLVTPETVDEFCDFLFEAWDVQAIRFGADPGHIQEFVKEFRPLSDSGSCRNFAGSTALGEVCAL